MIVQEIEQKNVELISNSRIKEIAKEQNIEGVVVDQIISILYDRGDITYPMKGYVGLIKGKKLAKTEHKQEKFDSYVYPIETVLFGKENNIDYYRNLYNKSIYSDDISQISAALIGLSELGEDIYPYLIGIAKSEKTTPITKEYAIKSLIDLGERAIPFLINLLGNHEDYEVSESIILIILNSIGKIGGEKVIEFIVPLKS